jgi:integrase
MPRKARFSQAFLDGLETAKRVEWWDEAAPGLLCRVSPTGSKTFYWFGRVKGRLTRIKIGRYPVVAIPTARNEAKRYSSDAAIGQPVKSRSKASSVWTLRQLHSWYMETHSRPHKRTWKWDERQMANRFEPWADRLVTEIIRLEVQQFHLELGKSRGTYAANKMLELLGTMFRAAAVSQPDRIPCDDPTKGIRRFPRQERETFLDAEQLPKFLAAVKTLQREESRDFLLLALWTGARRDNVCQMRWEEISLETAIWTIPASKSKNKRPMNVALSPPAIEILERRKRTSKSPWVLPGQGQTGHIVDPREAMKSIRKKIGVKDLRIHDLRRTLGSWMAINNPLQTVGKQLGHASIRSTQIYARLANETLKEAVNEAAALMQAPAKKQ